MNYRSPLLLRLARGQDCMVQIPDICNGNSETTVAAHANWPEYGKGMSLKAHDFAIAFACSDCHAAIDGQRYRLTADERKYYWLAGHISTLLILFNKHIKVTS